MDADGNLNPQEEQRIFEYYRMGDDHGVDHRNAAAGHTDRDAGRIDRDGGRDGNPRR